MSILEEYEYIRNLLRPGEFAAIETYLSLHKELYLSDIYYKQEEYEKFDAWWMETLNKGKMYLATSFPIYKDGEAVLYQNGGTFELGIVKRKGNIPDTYFVWYHTGDTTACTHARNLHKIFNGYAYTILRRSVEDSIDMDPCRQLSNEILDKLNDIVIEKYSEPLFDDFSDSEDDEPSTEGLVGGSYYDMEDAVTELIKKFK